MNTGPRGAAHAVPPALLRLSGTHSADGTIKLRVACAFPEGRAQGFKPGSMSAAQECPPAAGVLGAPWGLPPGGPVQAASCLLLWASSGLLPGPLPTAGGLGLWRPHGRTGPDLPVPSPAALLAITTSSFSAVLPRPSLGGRWKEQTSFLGRDLLFALWEDWGVPGAG